MELKQGQFISISRKAKFEYFLVKPSRREEYNHYFGVSLNNILVKGYG